MGTTRSRGFYPPGMYGGPQSYGGSPYSGFGDPFNFANIGSSPFFPFQQNIGGQPACGLPTPGSLQNSFGANPSFLAGAGGFGSNQACNMSGLADNFSAMSLSPSFGGGGATLASPAPGLGASLPNFGAVNFGSDFQFGGTSGPQFNSLNIPQLGGMGLGNSQPQFNSCLPVTQPLQSLQSAPSFSQFNGMSPFQLQMPSPGAFQNQFGGIAQNQPNIKCLPPVKAKMPNQMPPQLAFNPGLTQRNIQRCI